MTWAHESVFPFTALLTSGSEAAHDVYVGGDARAGMARKGPGLVMRYADDKLASERHMGALKDAFGDHLETVELTVTTTHCRLWIFINRPTSVFRTIFARALPRPNSIQPFPFPYAFAIAGADPNLLTQDASNGDGKDIQRGRG
ncbi:hypothetical protein [Ruegeria sp. AU67]|uniref:hypothetical protein n=1 Tax=Ruegeria sp. AU67 TaxID=2108530 RepID=UPI000D69427D|nr:hypothetical protein [Ruegeria sp. AU67]